MWLQDIAHVFWPLDVSCWQDGYILPGLGDAGDREFQTGEQLEKVENAHKKQKL